MKNKLFIFFSWGCIKTDCKAYFTQAQDSHRLIQGQFGHTCKLEDHKSALQKIASTLTRQNAQDEKATTPQACYNLLDDE